MNQQYEFILETKNLNGKSINKIQMSIDGHLSIGQLIQEFERFLLGCGFNMDGLALTLVDRDDVE